MHIFTLERPHPLLAWSGKDVVMPKFRGWFMDYGRNLGRRVSPLKFALRKKEVERWLSG